MNALKKIKRIILFIILGIFVLLMHSCEKFVAIDPPKNALTSRNVYSDNLTAIATLNGLYARIAEQLPNGLLNVSTITTVAGLSADELSVLPGQQDPSLQAYYKNELTANNPLNTLWVGLYIHANAFTGIIEGLNGQPSKSEDPSSNLTDPVRKQLLGEAKFMRAFCYFYLVNLYGDVPLQLTTNTIENAKRSRTPVSEVYAQITKDLEEARSSLSEDYLSIDLVTKSAERVRPNKGAATALLSRVYLYTGNWSAAAAAASELISNTRLYSLAPLATVFNKSSSEAIFQLQPVTTGWNTGLGRVLILNASGPTVNGNKPFYLNISLVNSFATDDPRKSQWISSVTTGATTYYYPFKYKKGLAVDGTITSTGQMTEYMLLFRLAEQYLIRAEAFARQDKLTEAIADINAIRTRARSGGAANVVPNYQVGLSQQEVLNAISLERKLELFTEWGDRWLDLKRTGQLDGIMQLATPLKGGSSWRPHQAIYPVRRADIIANPNLTQNIGY